MTLRETLAKNLRMLRAKRGLSQERLALEAEIDRSYVSLLETKKYSASLDMIERLAVALGVEPLMLLTPERRRPGPKLLPQGGARKR